MTMASGVFGISLRDQFDTSAIGMDVIGAGMLQELVSDTFTPNYDTHTSETDITNEIGASGDYTTGGVAVASPTWTAASPAATQIKYDKDDDAYTGMTATGIRGRIIYDGTPTTPTADPLWCGTTFGSDYSVTAGTLTITEDANGVFYVDYA